MARLVVSFGLKPDGTGTTLDFGFATLRTMSYEVEPAYDDSGRDLLYGKVVLDVSGIVNKVAIATNKQPDGVSPEGRGDDLAWTMWNVRDFLMTPRTHVRFEVGSQVVLETPANTEQGYLACDAKGGPFPKRAVFTQFAGTKLAHLHYRVETYVSYTSRALLSNRWSLRAVTDEHGYTTRFVRGKAVFRKDYLLDQNPPWWPTTSAPS